jgi:GMP synthase (glutamine-hydrolysing)
MILIVDFGSQTAHLIGRRLRQLGIQTEYTNPEEALEVIKSYKRDKETKGNTTKTSVSSNTSLKGIILSGGPASVYETGAPTISNEIFELGIPLLGICYGWQLTAHLLGGSVESGTKEYGPEKLELRINPPAGEAGNHESGILQGFPESSTVIVSHGDSVTKLPEKFTNLASTKTVEFSAVVNEKDKIFGVQFHPEAAHTEFGNELLKNFALLCGEKPEPLNLDPEKIIADIKQLVGNNKVIAAVSGGVDSTVAAYLIGKAIGSNLIPVYVESGLMRANTDKHVSYIFKELIKSNLVIIDARKRFIDNLKGFTDPEAKRKVIGKLYVDIFQEVAMKHREAKFLGQGTIYSDVIESKGSKHASHIKSHHNVGGLPKELKLKLLEPNRNYYKDEVREIGRLAGLPEEVVMQQPWPGPGHAVNIMGEVTEKRLAQVMQADQIVVEEMKKAGLYEAVFECFAVMTGAYSTAVKGDGRVYAEVVAVRSYDSVDIMTAEWSRIPHEVLASISSRIVNEVPDVSRVVYDITTKPPATMRWE